MCASAEEKQDHSSYDQCSKETRARSSLCSSAFTRTTISTSAEKEKHFTGNSPCKQATPHTIKPSKHESNTHIFSQVQTITESSFMSHPQNSIHKSQNQSTYLHIFTHIQPDSNKN
jgi:hypothetical protein